MCIAGDRRIYPIFAAKNENKMEAVTTLKKIGTSRGFIIPARILKKHNIKENDKVFYEETEDGLSVRFAAPTTGSIFDELHEINKLPGGALEA